MNCFCCQQPLGKNQYNHYRQLIFCCNDYFCLQCLFTPKIAQYYKLRKQLIGCNKCGRWVSTQEIFEKRLQIALTRENDDDLKYGYSKFLFNDNNNTWKNPYNSGKYPSLNSSFRSNGQLMKSYHYSNGKPQRQDPKTIFNPDRKYERNEKMDIENLREVEQNERIKNNLEQLNIDAISNSINSFKINYDSPVVKKISIKPTDSYIFRSY